MPNAQFSTPTLNERQIAHRRAMLAHLAQMARRQDYRRIAWAQPQLSIVHPTEKLTHRNAMDTIAMDER